MKSNTQEALKLAQAVIDAARAAMDESFEAGNEQMDISIPAHLAAALSLRLDEYDREALAEQPAIKQDLTPEQPAPVAGPHEQQEPVAWADLNALTEQFNSVNCGTAYRLPGEGRQPLYTSPPAQQHEPFGYFKPEPFGWTDCAETDEGAIALYDRPPASKPWVHATTWRGLTDKDLAGCDDEEFKQARYWEQVLREKNT